MRETLKAALQGWIGQIDAARDPSLALDPGALAATRELADDMQAEDTDLEARHMLGWMYFYQSLALPRHQGDYEAAMAALEQFTPCFLAGEQDLPQPMLPAIADAVAEDAAATVHGLRTSHDIAQISAAARMWQRIIVVLPDDHPERALHLRYLALALQLLAEQSAGPQSIGLLDEAIAARERAVNALPVGAPDRASALCDLGATWQLRFERTNAIEDVDKWVEAFERGVEAAPATDPDLSRRLGHLSTALRNRFERTGTMKDADKAVQTARKAVAVASHEGRPDALSVLGAALRTQFEHTADPDQINEAVEQERHALAAVPTDADDAKYLSGLGIALGTRFKLTGRLEDIDEAVSRLQQAVDATPKSAAGLRARRLSHLGAAHSSRFDHIGAVVDLDDAIAAGRQALQLAAAAATDVPMYMSNLGSSLQKRFVRTGASSDIDEAVDILRKAVGATEPDHPDRAGRLSNLSNALQVRFERYGRMADADEAVDTARQATEATEDTHLGRVGRLSNLSNALQVRFERTGQMADLDEAIDTARQAADTSQASSDRRDLPVCLSTLSIALLMRFQRGKQTTDLDEAVNAARRAVEATPENSPARADWLFNLGTALHTQFQHTGNVAHARGAIDAFAGASKTADAAPSTRIHAARTAAGLAVEQEVGTRYAAELLESAVQLLPEVAPRQLERADQQYELGGFAGLASDAAALALADQDTARDGHRPAKALRLLESGRAVLLSQLLDTRSDLTDLQRANPELAKKLADLREQLDPAFAQGAAAALGRDPAVERHVAALFSATVAEIRRLPGFESFLFPPDTKTLTQDAAQGPIVVFNISNHRSDALLITPDGVTDLPLPRLDLHSVTGKINQFQTALEAHDEESLSGILEWLWDVAAEPILETLGYRIQPPSTAWNWPRIWWSPGGLLGQLPLHAAGYHRQPIDAKHPRTVMDRVVSAYTPTVRALHYARQPIPAPSTSPKALIVAMPTTPDAGDLPNVAVEAAMLKDRLPHSILLEEKDAPPGEDTADPHTPTKSRVLTELSGCAIAHFACHGLCHPTDPSQSRLLLHDHRSDPLTVASLAQLKLDSASLAYLSACRTTFTGEPTLVDEAIHLTSGFQLAGFHHVVGTLWEIDDAVACRVADGFYGALQQAPEPLGSGATAHALHHAVRAIRDGQDLPKHLDRRDTPSRWAAYVHAGA
ncbi:CHAT domain-containing protein [Streptomyces sp. NPDC048001]|uniref:CHAT domain-containing tetratricopeptide repeat protein n=1 Tax=Streptomyces sp. NPDC048001 TaxID=3365498 RepID=UPI0037122206